MLAAINKERHLKIFAIILTLNFEISNAAPFESSGLIDLKNEGSKRGSCIAVGQRLQLATGAIFMEILKRPAQGQDGIWKLQRDTNQITDFGSTGPYWANKLRENIHQIIPPSQYADYDSAMSNTTARFDSTIKNDPWKGVRAWEYCGKIYSFIR